ncbi:hypothetical protein PAXRUDRAFT_168419 [Paxillus rubicundulus Ve08.2h10]|uniref:Uncharacterized protein n=1 Tax=Paxillus rubicundulus Ve08.2h10 TaxID=930991 RepID=A0A0D0D928_9AGAM|nr:hypothetical protein PAXRUDRAFT_168419 [Paxillus rubicundulus Ve08.2h10]
MLLTGYLRTTNHIVENLTDTIKHLTSGLLFPLMHGVVLEDLHCSWTLWKRLPLNLHANWSHVTLKRGWEDLLSIHRDLLDEAGLTFRNCFNSWKMLSDLIHFSPAYFASFKDCLCNLEVVEAILVIKTPIIAAHAMDVSNSTVARNIQSKSIINLLQQGGIENTDKFDDTDA